MMWSDATAAGGGEVAKALLSEFALTSPRTHNLRLLMELLADAGHLLPPELADLDTLTPFGTLFRYEDIPSQTHLAREAARSHRMSNVLALHHHKPRAIRQAAFSRERDPKSAKLSPISGIRIGT